MRWASGKENNVYINNHNVIIIKRRRRRGSPRHLLITSFEKRGKREEKMTN